MLNRDYMLLEVIVYGWFWYGNGTLSISFFTCFTTASASTTTKTRLSNQHKKNVK